MATAQSEPNATSPHHRPFRTLEDSFSRWNPSADVEVDGDDRDDLLIGGDLRGPSPRATVTLIGTGGSLIRGGTLIGAGGTRAPLDPAPPAGSGGASVRALHDPERTGAWDGADDDIALDHDLLVSLAADRERLTEIARALGACPECWGERIGCARCGGIGRPGSDDPAPDAFDWYVRPLLNRLDGSGSLRRRPRPAGSEAHPAGRGLDADPAPS